MYLAESSDVSLANEALTFPIHSTENAIECVAITIINDAELEGDETFTVLLTTQDPDITLGNNITTINIIDDEGELVSSWLV